MRAPTRRCVRPTLEVLEDRIVPTNITYHGGPTIPHVQVTNIVMGAQPFDPNALVQALVSDYLPLLGPNYGIGAGTLRSSINVSPLPGNPGLTQIDDFLMQEIKSGAVPPPGPNQVYMIFLAPGQTFGGGSEPLGFHGVNENSFEKIYYAVVDGTPGQASQTASHELAEAVTDPDVASGFNDPNLGYAGEVADIYELQNLTFPLDGYQMSVLSGPQGQKIDIPPPATLPNLIALAFQEVEALALDYFAGINPALTPYAQLANALLNANLLYGTPQGQIGVFLGEAVYSNWLSQQNGG